MYQSTPPKSREALLLEKILSSQTAEQRKANASREKQRNRRQTFLWIFLGIASSLACQYLFTLNDITSYSSQNTSLRYAGFAIGIILFSVVYTAIAIGSRRYIWRSLSIFPLMIALSFAIPDAPLEFLIEDRERSFWLFIIMPLSLIVPFLFLVSSLLRGLWHVLRYIFSRLSFLPSREVPHENSESFPDEETLRHILDEHIRASQQAGPKPAPSAGSGESQKGKNRHVPPAREVESPPAADSLGQAPSSVPSPSSAPRAPKRNRPKAQAPTAPSPQPAAPSPSGERSAEEKAILHFFSPCSPDHPDAEFLNSDQILDELDRQDAALQLDVRQLGAILNQAGFIKNRRRIAGQAMRGWICIRHPRN